MGNHDHESEWTHNQIYEYLATFPAFVGEIGPEDISGEEITSSACNLQIRAQRKALLYFIDSMLMPRTRPSVITTG